MSSRVRSHTGQIAIRSPLLPEAAERSIQVSLSVRTRRVTRAAVCGRVENGVVHLEARCPPGGNRIRPQLVGRLDQDGNGSVLRGDIRDDLTLTRPILAVFGAILGIVLVGGTAAALRALVTHHRADALHWLPAVIGPLVLAAFAVVVLADMRRCARRDTEYLIRWLARRLRAGSDASGPLAHD